MPLSPGTLLGQRYEVQAFLGLGEFIESYKALDLRLGRDVSIACLDLHGQDPVVLMSFEREAQRRAAFRHPGVAAVHDVGQDSSRIFLVSEWLSGESLRRRLLRGPLDWPDARRIGREVMEALLASRLQALPFPFPETAWIFLESRGETKLLSYLGLGRADEPPLSQTGELIRLTSALLEWTQEAIPAPALARLKAWHEGRELPTQEAMLALLAPPSTHLIASRKRLLLGAGLLGAGFLAGALSMWAWLSPRPARSASLAILPFQVPPDQLEQEQLGANLSRHLLLALSRVPELRVIQPGPGAQGNPSSLAGVDWVVSGVVKQRGPQVFVEARLSRGSAGKVVHRISLSRPEQDLLRLADDLSGDLLAILAPPTRTPTRLSSAGTRNPEAFRLYLQGRHFLASRDPEGFRRAQACFQASLTQDADNPLALAGLADAYNLMGVWQLIPPFEAGRLASEAARKALALDPSLPEAHASLAYARFRFYLDWAGAEEGFRQALRLDPGFAHGHHWYGFFLSTLGRWNEAFVHLQRAVELDPVASAVRVQYAVALHWAGRSPESLEEFRKVFEVDPGNANALDRYRQVKEDLGHFEEVFQVLEQEVQLKNFPKAGLQELRAAYRQQGQTGYWKVRLRQMEQRGDPVMVAALAARLGEDTKVFLQLDQALKAHIVTLAWVPMLPAFQAYRNDPRFLSLLNRMEFPRGPAMAGTPTGR